LAELRDDSIQQIERWFVRRGVPHFIDGYNAREDIFTRASAALGIWFLVAMSGFSPFNTARENLLNFVVGLSVLAALLVANNWRRGRTLLSRPAQIGAPSLTVFVILPALIPLIGGFQVVDALIVVAVQLVALAVIYFATSYAVFPIVYWAFGSLFGPSVGTPLGSIFGLFARALPLLLLITIVMFISAETWQVASGASGTGYAATMALFVAVGLVFQISRLPRELDELVERPAWERTVELVRATPVAGIALAMDGAPPAPPALGRNQRWNLGLVLLVRQSLQVLLVALLIGLFFLALGQLFIEPEVIASWTGTSTERLVTYDVFVVSATFSRQLLLVAGFLAAFSGLYFAVYVSTDATYRQEFHHEVANEVRRALAVREVYRALLEQGIGIRD
jgi:hypothetical protein